MKRQKYRMFFNKFLLVLLVSLFLNCRVRSLYATTRAATDSAAQDTGLDFSQFDNLTIEKLGQSCDNCDLKDVFISGSYAYCINGTDHLVIIDISSLETPTIIGQLNFSTASLARSVFVSGANAFVLTDSNLIIVDISTPFSPTITGQYQAEKSLVDFSISGDFAYVVSFLGDLIQVDISNTTNPFKFNETSVGRYCTAILIHHDLAYISHAIDGFCIVDISNPLSPAKVGEYSYDGLGHLASSLTVSGSYLYLTDIFNGLDLFDITDVTTPQFLGGVELEGEPSAVAVYSNYATVALDLAGIAIIDCSNTTEPVVVGTFDDGGEATNLFLVENIAYVADGSGGLEIFKLGYEPTKESYLGFLAIIIICIGSLFVLNLRIRRRKNFQSR